MEWYGHQGENVPDKDKYALGAKSVYSKGNLKSFMCRKLLLHPLPGSFRSHFNHYNLGQFICWNQDYISRNSQIIQISLYPHLYLIYVTEQFKTPNYEIKFPIILFSVSFYLFSILSPSFIQRCIWSLQITLRT